jgi:hypothetical protein
MTGPKHDRTLAEEVTDGIAENIRRGLMIEVSPGRYALTLRGERR